MLCVPELEIYHILTRQARFFSGIRRPEPPPATAGRPAPSRKVSRQSDPKGNQNIITLLKIHEHSVFCSHCLLSRPRGSSQESPLACIAALTVRSPAAFGPGRLCARPRAMPPATPHHPVSPEWRASNRPPNAMRPGQTRAARRHAPAIRRATVTALARHRLAQDRGAGRDTPASPPHRRKRRRTAPRGPASRKPQCAHRGPATVARGRGLGQWQQDAAIVRQGTRPGSERQPRRQMTAGGSSSPGSAGALLPDAPDPRAETECAILAGAVRQASGSPEGETSPGCPHRAVAPPRATGGPRRNGTPTRPSGRAPPETLGRRRQCHLRGEVPSRRRKAPRPTRSARGPCPPG